MPLSNMRANGVRSIAVSCFFRPQNPANIKAVRRPIPTRMHRFAAVAAMGIFVASCAGTIKEGMTRLQGQPLSAVIAEIGVPNDERMVAGKRVYIWGSPGPSEKESKEKGCQIRATMNGDVIETFDYQGDEKLCQRYAERLRPYFDLKNSR